jgi:hypothetical protein
MAGPDGRRVVVQLRDETDVETGGHFTLKRWRITKTDKAGAPCEIQFRPDNPDFKPLTLVPGDAELRVVAEFLEVVG